MDCIAVRSKITAGAAVFPDKCTVWPGESENNGISPYMNADLAAPLT